MPIKQRLLKTQTLKYDDVVFEATSLPSPSPLVPMPTALKQSGRPTRAAAGTPQWQFEWQTVADGGLRLTNLAVLGSDPDAPTASVPVAELVDSTDLKIAFSDTPNVLDDFPVAAAFGHTESQYEHG